MALNGLCGVDYRVVAMGAASSMVMSFSTTMMGHISIIQPHCRARISETKLLHRHKGMELPLTQDSLMILISQIFSLCFTKVTRYTTAVITSQLANMYVVIVMKSPPLRYCWYFAAYIFINRGGLGVIDSYHPVPL